LFVKRPAQFGRPGEGIVTEVEMLVSRYSRREEWANIATHGLGVALSVVALIMMLVAAARHGDSYHVTGVAIFGGSLILLYLMSTLYHTFTDPRRKHFFRMLDHASIYLLIAGSYTPFMLVPLRGGWGWTLLCVTWGLAVAGVLFKFLHGKRFSALSVLIYIGMGWLVVVATKPVLERVEPGAILWLAVGGLFYTSGVAFYLWRRLPYHHAIWHLFVLMGSFSHFLAVYFYVLPSGPANPVN
jgi:hemolysin III